MCFFVIVLVVMVGIVVVVVVSIESASKQATVWALLLPVLALGLPIFDTLFAVTRRLWQGRPVTQRDEGHVHHRLLRAGYSHRQVALFLYAICLLLAGVAWTLKATHDPARAALIAGLGAVVLTIIHGLGLRRRFRREPDHNEGARQTRQQLRQHTRAIRRSVDIEELCCCNM